MDRFVDETKLAELLNQVQHAVTGVRHIRGNREVHSDGMVTFTLNTENLVHREAAAEGMAIVKRVLRRHFGSHGVSLQEILADGDNSDFIPPFHKLRVRLAVDEASYKKLELAHKDVAIECCKTLPALKGSIDKQLAYLLDELEPELAQEAITEVTGVKFEYKHRLRQRYAASNARQIVCSSR